MRKIGLLFFAVVLSFLMISPLFAQVRIPRMPQPPMLGVVDQSNRQSRGGQERERAEPRNRRQQPPREYAVPRTRPLPRPHPEFGPYNRRTHEGRYYFSRPYPRNWIRRNTCVAGYWEYDYWVGGYVWIEGYCNIRGYRPPPGFYLWFDFRR